MLEPTLLDELICHLASLASVYHRPPSSFVEGRHVARRQLPARVNGVSSAPGANYGDSQQVDVPAPTVIPTQVCFFSQNSHKLYFSTLYIIS